MIVFSSIRKLRLVVVVAVVLLVTAVPSGYFYLKYRQSQKLLESPSETVKKETKKLVEKVGKLIKLPTDEQPTIATVSDQNELPNQPFYEKAKNGDKVLVYYKAQKAILYDPVENIIVEVAHINLPTTTISPAVETETETSLSVAIYNGTSITGLARRAKKDLEGRIKNLEVVSVDNAKKNNYEESLVIDLGGNNKEISQQLATILQGSVSELPEGEKLPQATISGQTIHILAIIGKEYTKK